MNIKYKHFYVEQIKFGNFICLFVCLMFPNSSIHISHFHSITYSMNMEVIFANLILRLHLINMVCLMNQVNVWNIVISK